MIPIRLDWQRPRDGVEIVEGDNAGEPKHPDIDYRKLRARSERVDSVVYSITNLENSMAIRFLNTSGDDDLVTFVSRFGLPQKLLTPHQLSVASLYALKEDLEDILALGAFPNSIEKAQHANGVLKFVSLAPSFEHVGSQSKLVMRPTNLADFMIMEAVFAYEVGATLARCFHCSKAYLTGPLTGRRSHSVYCSDRCRVAAMRARNAAKGAD